MQDCSARGGRTQKRWWWRRLLLALGTSLCCCCTTTITAAEPAPQCPFCPKAKTVTTFGAASAEDTEIARLGGLTQDKVFQTVADEGLQLLDLTVYKCEDWDRLPSVLASAMRYNVSIVAGFESENDFAKFCPNFIGADGLPDWPSVAAQVANLSLTYPNLRGYRFDDFIGCCHLQQFGDQSTQMNRSIYYGGLPQETQRMQQAAKAINPGLQFLPVFYDHQLGYQSPFSFSFGQRAWTATSHHGSFLPRGMSVTMRVHFEVPTTSKVLLQGGGGAPQLTLQFLETTDFLYALDYKATQDPGLSGFVRRQVTLNGAMLLDHDLANITDSLYPGLAPFSNNPGYRVYMHSLNVSAAHVRGGTNVLEFTVLGVAPLSQWKTTRKNFVSLWDIEIGELDDDAGPRTVGNGSWADVNFVITNASSDSDLLPASHAHAGAAHTLGELFGGSNRPYSQLAYVDGLMLCWKQVDPQWRFPQERLLYTVLSKSARRALEFYDSHGTPALPRDNGDSGRRLILRTHFGMLDWANWDARVAVNPGSGMSRDGIQPATLNEMLMVDAVMADGILIWWDLVGLASDADAQRGVFAHGVAAARCTGGQPAQEYLQLQSVNNVGLLKGLYQMLSTAGTVTQATLTLQQRLVSGQSASFRVAVELMTPSTGEWREITGRPSNASCPPMSCTPHPLLSSCHITCSGDSHAKGHRNSTQIPNAAEHGGGMLVTVTLSLRYATKLRVVAKSVRDLGGSLGLCMNASLTSAKASTNVPGFDSKGVPNSAKSDVWVFESGLDSRETSVLVEHRTIVNATRLIRECSCNCTNTSLD